MRTSLSSYLLWTILLRCGSFANGFSPPRCLFLHGRLEKAPLRKAATTPFQRSIVLYSSTQGGDDNDRGIAAESPRRTAVSKDRQSEYLAEARDPFSFIRIGIWSLLGIGGLVGTFTSVTGASAEASGWQNLQNTVINLIVTIVMVGVLYLEFNIGNKGKEIVSKELENPMLKGNSGFFVDPKEQTAPVVEGEEDDIQ